MARQKQTTSEQEEPNNDGIKSVTFSDEGGKSVTMSGEEFSAFANQYKTIKESCRVQLTDSELLLRGNELVQERNREDAEVLRHKAEKEQHKFNLADINSDIVRLHHAIENKFEYRDIDCWERPRYSQGLMEIVRSDTREIIKTRKMTEDEMQDSLFSN